MPEIVQTKSNILSFPLVEPFAVATRTAYHAENVILQITDENGVVGIGSAAPVPYITGETVDTVSAILTTCGDFLVGRSTKDLSPLLAKAKEIAPDQPAARAAIEVALYDLWAKNCGIPLWSYFGGANSLLVADTTISIVEIQRATELAFVAWQEGFTHLKVKVGHPGGIDNDLQRIKTIVEAVPDAILRIDANQAFTPDQAIHFANMLLSVTENIELIEQPVDKEDTDGLRYVHDRINVPLFADEAVLTPSQADYLTRNEIVDGINVKLMKSGLADAFAIASLCKTRGVKLMIGCMLETNLSLSAACAFAGGTGWFDYIDLDSHRLLSPTELFTGGIEVYGPNLNVNTTLPGLGVRINSTVWQDHVKPA